MRGGLVSLLKAESTVTDVVGSRIYIGKAPQTADLPYIVLTDMASDELETMDSAGGLRFIDFDIDCKSNRSVQADALAAAVRNHLRGYTGAAGTQTVKAVVLNGEALDFEPPTDGSDDGIYTVTVDVQIQYTPA